jgi:hypothetical protein
MPGLNFGFITKQWLKPRYRNNFGIAVLYYQPRSYRPGSKVPRFKASGVRQDLGPEVLSSETQSSRPNYIQVINHL